MDVDEQIRDALNKIGQQDLLTWARFHVTLSLFALNEALGAGILPIQLGRHMAEVALNSGRYDEFMRGQAVRLLNQYFPYGFGRSDQQQYWLDCGWSNWGTLTEAAHQGQARQVWDAITERLRLHPDWVPQDLDDPLLQEAFAGTSFEPTEGAKRLADVERRIYREVMRGNHPFSYDRAVTNLSQLPPGYGYVYGMNEVDGGLWYDGFVKFYDGTGGATVGLAIEGFRLLGRHDLAELVEKSRVIARRLRFLQFAAWLRRLTRARAVRDLNQLEMEYGRLTQEQDWLELALIKLVQSRPELFGEPTP